MAFVAVLLLVSLPLLDAEKVTTLDDIFIQSVNAPTQAFVESVLELHKNTKRLEVDRNSPFVMPFTKELFEYTGAIERWILTEYARVLAAVPAQSVLDDVNEHCSQYEKTAIGNFAVIPTNTSCAQNRLGKMMTSQFNMAVDAGLGQVSRECIKKEPSFCSVASRNCTLAHEERIKQILLEVIEDWNKVPVAKPKSIISFLVNLAIRDIILLFEIYSNVNAVYNTVIFVDLSSLANTPLEVENIVRPYTNNAIRETLIASQNYTASQDKMTWGIIRSNTGKVDLPCSYYRNDDSHKSGQFLNFLTKCLYPNLLQSNAELMVCAYADFTSRPLTWSTVPFVYFHSQCLCLVFQGKGCRVKAPQGVDPRFYCLSVLLRDFQRQVSFRPAVTYLDYAFQTRVPVCKFSKLIPSVFRRDCKTVFYENVNFFQSVQCYFMGLVNKPLNCSETLVVNTFNHTELCNLMRFIRVVLCDDDPNDDVRVPYYGAGDSTLVLLLTYVEVVVRVLTIVTYLACPQLRNLPGKLLICYQVTALLRFLVVHAGVDDFQMAVRLDVAMDLASTLWLTSYLHFLTASIKALRLPDSLRPDEVRMVLLRYALLGWALPTALAAGFFRMDEVVDSRVQFGQVLFVLCNYAALFGNLYMFYHNCSFYYDVKSSARLLQRGGKARSVFAGLFKFALKTSVLSGAGITFRLVFTQIQGVENLLGYYHALGTLQGLLLFFLYGCNCEARAFWTGVFRSTLRHCQRRQIHTPDP